MRRATFLPLLALPLAALASPDDIQKKCDQCAAPLDRACGLNKGSCDTACDSGAKSISPAKLECLQACKNAEVACFRRTDATCGYCRNP